MDGRLQRVDLSSRNWWKSIIFVRDRFLTLKKISSKGKKKEKEKIVARLFLPLFILSIRSLGFSERATFQGRSSFPFFKKIGLSGLQQATRPINHSVLAEFLLLLLSFLAQPSLAQSSPRFRSNFARNNYSLLLEPSRTISGISSFRFSAISRSRIRIGMIFVEK